MNPLQALKDLPANHVWTIEEDEVHLRLKEKGSCQNLIDFVWVVQLAHRQLENESQPLSDHEVHQISTNLLKQAEKLQKSLLKQNFLINTALKIVVWLYTGTTFQSVMGQFRQTLDQRLYACLNDPQLILDGEIALTSLEAYKNCAKKYFLPFDVVFSPRNSILYYLRQKMCSDWKEIRCLIKKGRTLEDAEVIELCDRAMQAGGLARKLAIKYETTWASESNGKTREKNMVYQSEYSWLIDIAYTQFYLWIRSMPVYHSEGTWERKAKEHPPLESKFYQPDSPQNGWRESYNETMQVLFEELDVVEINKFDQRYFHDLDTPETFIQDIQTPSSQFIYSDQTNISEKRIEEIFQKTV